MRTIISMMISTILWFNSNAQLKSCEYPDTLWIYGSAETNDYGFSAHNPIRVGGGTFPNHIYRYLNNLTDSSGNNISFVRIGSCCDEQIGRKEPLTKFKISIDNNNKDTVIYFDQYIWEKPKLARGFNWKEHRRGYVGEFKNDTIFDGYGIYFFEDGGYYRGSFKDGIMNGHGILFIVGQETYTGEFSDGEYNGIGTLEYADGGRYIGNWKKGIRHGKGQLFYPPNSKIKYIEGEFNNDKPKGKFTLTKLNGEQETRNY